MRSELDWIRLELAALVHPLQTRGGVFPHQQHRALARVALMADVGWHRRHIARLHAHLGTRCTGIFVLDFPVELIAELNEPLDAVIAVLDRQDVLLGRRAAQAATAY